MFNMKLPHGLVHPPVAGACHYQDGHYYDADRRYVFSNPGLAPPPGVKTARTMEQALEDFEARERAQQKPQESAPAAPAAPAETATPAAPPVVETPAAPTQAPETGLTREQKLMQLPFPKLQELQLAALRAMHPDKEVAVLKKDLIKGAGGKAKIIAWLLENTAE